MSIEDRQAEVFMDWDDVKERYAADERAEVERRLNDLNDRFSEAYEEDDDDTMYDAIEDMEQLITSLSGPNGRPSHR